MDVSAGPLTYSCVFPSCPPPPLMSVSSLSPTLHGELKLAQLHGHQKPAGNRTITQKSHRVSSQRERKKAGARALLEERGETQRTSRSIVTTDRRTRPLGGWVASPECPHIKLRQPIGVSWKVGVAFHCSYT